jgi:hypothetical protein
MRVRQSGANFDRMTTPDLPIAGRAIDEVAWGRGGLWLRFWSPGAEYGLHIEGEFRVVTTGVAEGNNPRLPNATWFELVGRTVQRATATEDGGLTIRFIDDGELVVPSGAFEHGSSKVRTESSL